MPHPANFNDRIGQAAFRGVVAIKYRVCVREVSLIHQYGGTTVPGSQPEAEDFFHAVDFQADELAVDDIQDIKDRTGELADVHIFCGDEIPVTQGVFIEARIQAVRFIAGGFHADVFERDVAVLSRERQTVGCGQDAEARVLHVATGIGSEDVPFLFPRLMLVKR